MRDKALITKTYEVFWMDDNTICIRILPNAEVQLEDVEKMLHFQREQKVTTENFRIIHAQDHASMSKDAREFIQEHAPDVKAEAYVLSNLAQKIVFNLYANIRKNQHPIKGFSKIADAQNWLKKHQ